MQSRLLARETGTLSPSAFTRAHTTDLLHTFAPAPQHRFNGELTSDPLLENRPHSIRAHGAGVSSLALEKFDGRILLSGGADGGIKLWDLDGSGSPYGVHTFRPVGTIGRADGQRVGHSHGITHLGFYPFDPDAFLSSSYDKTLKMWSTARCALSASFNLNATIYSHSTSPVADHLLVACATQHSHVRLVDLKSGSAVQTLIAHGGPVLSTAWSPRQGHILVSGHADGKARIWDVRRAGGVLAQLDQEDSLGIVHKFRHAVAAGLDNLGQVSHRLSARAHDEAVNGVQWTSDGRYIVTAGLDGRIRVWDADTGANTLASFGSLVQNKHARTVDFILSPSGVADQDVLFWPNDQEILIFDLHNGDLITRLRSPGATNPLGLRGTELGRNRISSLAWRGHGGGSGAVGSAMGGSNCAGAVYSAHLDGQIRAWMPEMLGPDELAEEEMTTEEEESKKRKRKVVDNAYRSLMGKQITFQ